MFNCPYCGIENYGNIKTLRGLMFCPNCLDTFYITNDENFIIHDYTVPEMPEHRKQLLKEINKIMAEQVGDDTG